MRRSPHSLPAFIAGFVFIAGLIGCGASATPTEKRRPPPAAPALTSSVATQGCLPLFERALAWATVARAAELAAPTPAETFLLSSLRAPEPAAEGPTKTFRASLVWPGGTGWGTSGRGAPATVPSKVFVDLTPAVAELLLEHDRREDDVEAIVAFELARIRPAGPCSADVSELQTLSQTLRAELPAREERLLRALNREDREDPADRVLLGYLTARSDLAGEATRSGPRAVLVPPRAEGFRILSEVAANEKASPEVRARAHFILGRLFREPAHVAVALTRTSDTWLRLLIKRVTVEKFTGKGHLYLFDEPGLAEVLDDLARLGEEPPSFADLLRLTVLNRAGANEGPRFFEVATRCARHPGHTPSSVEHRRECALAIGARLAFYPEEPNWETSLPIDMAAAVAASLARISGVLGDYDQVTYAAQKALELAPGTRPPMTHTEESDKELVKANAWEEVFTARIGKVANFCAPQRSSTLTIESGPRRATVKVESSDVEFKTCMEREGPRFFRSLPRVRGTLRVKPLEQ